MNIISRKIGILSITCVIGLIIIAAAFWKMHKSTETIEANVDNHTFDLPDSLWQKHDFTKTYPDTLLSRYERRRKDIAAYGMDSLQKRLNVVLNKEMCYLTSTYIPYYSKGHSTTWNFGTPNDHREKRWRHPAVFCYSLATLLALDEYDQGIVKKTRKELNEMLHMLIIGLCENHVANGGKGWGGDWQSSHWANMLGMAAFLCNDILSLDEQVAVKKTILYEADNVICLFNGEEKIKTFYWKSPKYDVDNTGDSKSEEVAWYNAVVLLASILYPDDQSNQQYKKLIAQLGLITYSTEKDLQSDEIINGIKLSSLEGWNIESDGTVINHNIVHPDYMISAGSTLFPTVAMSFYLGYPVPKAIMHNVDNITKGLTDNIYSPKEGYNMPGGTIYCDRFPYVYYPNGNDWGTVRIADKLCWDVLAMNWNWGVPACFGKWANLHLGVISDMQDRFETGQVYRKDSDEDLYGIDGEDSKYPLFGHEIWLSQNFATALMVNRVRNAYLY